MPSDHAYQYSRVDMSLVMQSPEEFIIPENLEACKLLWSKNIFTVMTNNYDNEFSWITISNLSPENHEIFYNLQLDDKRVGLTWGGVGFRIPIVPGKGNDTFEAFKELIDKLEPQDVQLDGCMSIEEFMTYYTNCFRMDHTPEYLDLVKDKMSPDGDVLLYSKEFEQYVNFMNIRRRIRVFDPSLMIKTYEEYIADSQFAGLYDPDNGMVYYNKMYYDAHMRYKSEHKTPKLT